MTLILSIQITLFHLIRLFQFYIFNFLLQYFLMFLFYLIQIRFGKKIFFNSNKHVNKSVIVYASASNPLNTTIKIKLGKQLKKLKQRAAILATKIWQNTQIKESKNQNTLFEENLSQFLLKLTNKDIDHVDNNFNTKKINSNHII